MSRPPVPSSSALGALHEHESSVEETWLREFPHVEAQLLRAAHALLGARSVDDVATCIKRAARALTGADGVTFILRDGDVVRYIAEDAIGPLWTGRSFSIERCISGWAIQHARAVRIPDISVDERIPQEAYRSTFVKSLAMVPIRREQPSAAIGAYWSVVGIPAEEHVRILEALGQLAARALENVAARDALQGDLQRRDRAMGVIAHDLRNMLTPVVLQVENVLRRGSLDVDSFGAWLVRIQKRLRTSQEFVTALTDVARFSVGEARLSVEPTDLVPLLREVAASFDELAGESGVTLRISAPDVVTGRWSEVRLQQLFNNLVGNAIKYGAGKPVDLTLTAQQDDVVVSVRDHGVGIAQHHLGRLFKAFERITEDRNIPGLGLGLWISSQIVHAHGGSITVDSTPGAGTAFTVRLPRNQG